MGPERQGAAIETRLRPLRRESRFWVAAYPLAWAALALVSSSYWFLPAGLRLAVLSFLPRRQWWAMATGEWLVLVLFALFRDTHATPLAFVLATFMPWCIYAGADLLYMRPLTGEATPQAMGRVWLTGLTVALGNGLLLTAVDSINSRVPDALVDRVFLYALGDFVGIVVMVPLLMLLRERVFETRADRPRIAAQGLVLLPAAVAVALTLLPLPEVVRYPVLLASFLLYVIAFQHGWRTTAVALVLLSATVHFAMPLMGDVRPAQLHLLTAASGCAALLLGTAGDVLRLQGVALGSTVHLLSMHTHALREAANRLSTRQEDELRRLGNELHDQLGQDMTAIATQLRLTERQVPDARTQQELRAIGQLVTGAHNHLREMIAMVHPLTLDRFGLARALSGGPLAEMARKQGIDYRCIASEGVDRLPATVAVAIYRICQEATTNAVKHGCGGRLHIIVSLEPAAGIEILELRIEDDAGRLEIPPDRMGFGLQTIQDRANALGAMYRFSARSGTPRHWLHMTLPPEEARARTGDRNGNGHANGRVNGNGR